MKFIRRRFHDEPELPLMSEPQPQPPRTPKEVYRRYGKEAVKEAEKTKQEVAKFEAEMSSAMPPPSPCVQRAVQSETNLFSVRAVPHTERSCLSASDLTRNDGSPLRRNDETTTATSPPGGFLRRLFSGRRNSRARSLAECAE